jgi:hypothetical protein
MYFHVFLHWQKMDVSGQLQAVLRRKSLQCLLDMMEKPQSRSEIGAENKSSFSSLESFNSQPVTIKTFTGVVLSLNDYVFCLLSKSELL